MRDSSEWTEDSDWLRIMALTRLSHCDATWGADLRRLQSVGTQGRRYVSGRNSGSSVDIVRAESLVQVYYDAHQLQWKQDLDEKLT